MELSEYFLMMLWSQAIHFCCVPSAKIQGSNGNSLFRLCSKQIPIFSPCGDSPSPLLVPRPACITRTAPALTHSTFGTASSSRSTRSTIRRANFGCLTCACRWSLSLSIVLTSCCFVKYCLLLFECECVFVCVSSIPSLCVLSDIFLIATRCRFC